MTSDPTPEPGQTPNQPGSIQPNPEPAAAPPPPPPPPGPPPFTSEAGRFQTREEYRAARRAAHEEYRQYRRSHRGFFWPSILILAGALFLLQNLGIVSWSLWANLWRLWPVLLIILGIELIFRDSLRGAPGLIVGFALVVLVIIGAIVASVLFPAPVLAPTSFTRAQALNAAKQASVQVDFGAGQLSLSALDGADPTQLSTISYSGPDSFRPVINYRVDSNGNGQLTYRPDNGGNFRGFPFNGNGSPSEQVALTPNIPLTLNVNEGASDSRIDLSKLKVSDLRVQTGASTTYLRLPEAAGATTALVQGGATTLTIEIPPSVGALINYRGGLSNLNVDQSRFPSTSAPTGPTNSGASTYQSPDYATATNKVTLQIETGVSSVTIR